MAICNKCGEELGFIKNICSSCFQLWLNMRKLSFIHLENKYGKLNINNRKKIMKEMRRLDNLWHKNKEEYEVEIKKENKNENPKNNN